MQPVKALAESVRADAQAGRRRTIRCSRWSRSPRPGSRPGWRATGSARDAMTEAMFLGTYGSPLLQAVVGLRRRAAPTQRRIERDSLREAIEAAMRRPTSSSASRRAAWPRR